MGLGSTNLRCVTRSNNLGLFPIGPAVSVLWLENTVFHVVYGNPSDPTHEYRSVQYLVRLQTEFIDPVPPYGVPSRLFCWHYARLVGWEPAKDLVVVADGPSTDVGAIACLNPSEVEGKPSPWVTLEVETSRILLPMDGEMNKTSIMGFDLDLTSIEPATSATPSKPSPFGQASTTPAAAPAFVQTSAPAFGQASGFGTASAFGSKPAFGSSAFGSSTGGGFGKLTSTTRAGAPPAGGFAGFGSKPATFGTSAPTTNIFGSSSRSMTPKTESPISAFGSSAFGGFGSSVPSVSSPVKPRDGSPEPDSPTAGAKAPIEMSPPGSPSGQSDSGIDVGGLDIGAVEKKLPAGLDASDGESEHGPTETPSKPPVSTSSFAGFGKTSAFGTAASGGTFAVKPPTRGAFGSTGGSAFGSVQPASGFGAFGSKAVAPSTGFNFGGGNAKKDEKPAGDEEWVPEDEDEVEDGDDVGNGVPEGVEDDKEQTTRV